MCSAQLERSSSHYVQHCGMCSAARIAARSLAIIYGATPDKKREKGNLEEETTYCKGGKLVLLLSILTILKSIVTQEILHAPESTVVFLDQSAVFTCETVGGALLWTVNGTQRETLSDEITRDLVISRTIHDGGRTEQDLTIPARAEYNGTRVQCLLFSLSGSDLSENATPLIQGPPSAVVNLTATNDATSVTISWEAPWSLNVTGVDPDILYSVLIQNVTDENKPTPISCTDCTNITETVYTFTPDHLSPCHVYNFSVTPFNGADQGKSDNVTFAVAVPDFKFGEPSIKARNDSNCDVIFQVSGNLAQVCSIALRDEMGEVYVAESLKDQAMVFKLPANKAYRNVSEVGTGDRVKTFTTFDVQDLHAKPMGDGQINVTGSFINESRAFGCFIAIQCNVTTEITFIALRRRKYGDQGISEVIPMPPSNYTVHAYDLEEGAQLNPWPANPDPVSVPVIPINGPNSKPKNEETLRNASISHTGSVVKIECVPEEESASCLVVYRAYGNSTLNVISNKTISVMVTLMNGNYTFAIFRKRNMNSIDREPFISRMVTVTVGGLSTPTTDDDKGASLSSDDVAGIIVILLVATGIIVVVVVMWRQKKVMCHPAFAPSGGGISCSSRVSYDNTIPIDPPIRHSLAEDGSATQAKEEESKCAMVETLKSGNRSPHSVAVMHDINNNVDVKPSTGRQATDVAKTEFPHVVVKRLNPTIVIIPSEEKTTKAKFQGPPTVETVMSLIYSARGKWREIALDLGFDEDYLDGEIFVNNETDEARLQDCVEQWVSRLGPSWEKLSLVLRDLGEERLAQQAWSGVSAEEVAEWFEQSERDREGSHEMVTGTREDTLFSDTSSDETRGETTDGSHEGGERGEEMRPFIGSYPTLQEEAPAISDCDEESDSFPVQEKDKEEEVNTTIHVPTPLPPNITTEDIGAYVHEEIAFFSLDNACFCGKKPVFNSLKDTDTVRPPTLPPSSRMEVKGTTQTQINSLPFLDPPETYRDKVVKWLWHSSGVHEPDSLCSRSSPVW